MKRLLINLPDKTYETLREYAFKKHTSMAEVVRMSLDFSAFVLDQSPPITKKIKESAIEMTNDMLEWKKTKKLCSHGFPPGNCKVWKCPHHPENTK